MYAKTTNITLFMIGLSRTFFVCYKGDSRNTNIKLSVICAFVLRSVLADNVSINELVVIIK